MIFVKGKVIHVGRKDIKTSTGKSWTVYKTWVSNGDVTPQVVECRNKYDVGQEVSIPCYIDIFNGRDGSARYLLKERKS